MADLAVASGRRHRAARPPLVGGRLPGARARAGDRRTDVLSGPILPTLLGAHDLAHHDRVDRRAACIGLGIGVARRAHRPAVPAGLRRGPRRCRWPCPEFVAGYTWVSIVAVDPGPVGRVARDDAVAVPARLPARRGEPAPQRPRARRGRRRPRHRAGRPVRAHHPAVGRPAARRRHAARRHVPARRVRRVRDPALPDVRHRDLHAVHARLRRAGRVGAHARAVPHRRRPARWASRAVGRAAHPGRESGRPAHRAPGSAAAGRSRSLVVLALCGAGHRRAGRLDRLLDGPRAARPRCRRRRSCGTTAAVARRSARSPRAWRPRWRCRSRC